MSEQAKQVLAPAHVIPFRAQRAQSQGRVTPSQLGIQTLISAGTAFSGNLESDGGMKIDGNIMGNISVKSETDAWVVVSNSARVVGNVTARVVAIQGYVKGVIRARNVVLMPTACVDGDIHYNTIKIADGAQIDGYLHKDGDISKECIKPSNDKPEDA